MKFLVLALLLPAVFAGVIIQTPDCEGCFGGIDDQLPTCPNAGVAPDGSQVDCIGTDQSCQPLLTNAGFNCPPVYQLGFDLGENAPVAPSNIPAALIRSFNVENPANELCCCPTHPRRANICVVVARSLCGGNALYPWKRCVELPTPAPTRFPTTRSPTPFPTSRAPTRFPTTRFPTSRGPTRFPTTRAPTPFPTTRFPTSRGPTRFPTSRAPTPFPTTRFPTSRGPTRFPTSRAPTPFPTTRNPTPAPTPGPTCECIFDPAEAPLSGFPVDVCEGTNGHRCICQGCDYTFNRADCIEWVQFDIKVDTFWRRTETYLIKGEIHVRDGARLTIEPGSVVLFEDGPVSVLLDGPRVDKTSTHFSTLVIDAGSSIDAQQVSFEGKSRGARNLAGGLVIVGSNSAAYDLRYPTIHRTVGGARGETSILSHVRFTDLGHQANPAPLTFIGADNLDVFVEDVFVNHAPRDAVQFWHSELTVRGITIGAAHRGIVAVGGSHVVIERYEQITAHRLFMVEAGSTVSGRALPFPSNHGKFQGLFYAYKGDEFSNADTTPRFESGVYTTNVATR